MLLKEKDTEGLLDKGQLTYFTEDKKELTSTCLFISPKGLSGDGKPMLFITTMETLLIHLKTFMSSPPVEKFYESTFSFFGEVNQIISKSVIVYEPIKLTSESGKVGTILSLYLSTGLPQVNNFVDLLNSFFPNLKDLIQTPPSSMSKENRDINTLKKI